MLDQTVSLLITKLYIPPLRATHVPRADLQSLLDTGMGRRLVLVAAAAGFGKTTLLAGWSSRHPGQVAWLSLDENDNSPVRFMSYFIAAVQTRCPDFGVELLAMLQSQQPPPVEGLTHILINQLAAIPDPLVIVLDDYQLIDNPAVHELLGFLLDRFPPGITLALLSRSDPPLSLARLRANNDLLEIRAASLRFSPEETGDFLTGMGIDLAPESIRALDARTEGWPVGVHLAGLAMQSHPGSREAFIKGFTGGHQFVLDYLIEEVLSSQPDDVRRFLLETSILRRLNASLCTALVDGVDGEAMLATLERNNLFLVPLDQNRSWYRYHHLFADLLQARLRAEHPDGLADLYRRAGSWYAGNNWFEESIDCFLAAHDYAIAVDLILGPLVGVVRRAEIRPLLRWYRAFPQDVLDANPRLVMKFAYACALGGRWDEAEPMMERLVQTGAQLPPADEALLAYLLPSYRPNTSQIALLAQDTTADLNTQTSIAMMLITRGDFDTASEMLERIQEACEREEDVSLLMTVLFHRCRLYAFRGMMRRSARMCHETLDRAAGLGGQALPMAAFGHNALGRVHIEWNEPDIAEKHLLEAIRLCEQTGFLTGLMSSSAIMLAEVEQARGNPESADAWLEKSISYAQRYDPQNELKWLQTYQARIWLQQGQTTLARKWLDDLNPRRMNTSLFFPRDIVAVTSARVHLSQRRPDQAIEEVLPVLDKPLNLLSTEAHGVLALSRLALGDTVNALIALEQALALGEQENRVRAFVELGVSMSRLLNRYCQEHPEHEFARRVMSAMPPSGEGDMPAEPLSDREIAVLRLIAAGRSNDEIAAELTIAHSTVKWYVNTLYAKLRVKTRPQAIARIHDLHLLEE